MRSGRWPGLLYPVFGFRLGHRLPLHVVHGVRGAVLEGSDVVLDVAGAWAGLQAGRGAGVFSLKVPAH